MMHGDRLFRVKIGHPAEPVAQRPAKLPWVPDMLMKALQRSDGEMGRRKLSSLAHHLSLIGTITVQCDEERMPLAAIVGHIEIVVKFRLGGDRQVFFRGSVVCAHS